VIAGLREFMLDLLDKVDWPLLLALCAVMAASLVVQSSAGGGDSHVVFAQGARFVAGLGVMVLLSRVSPARLRIWTPLVFGLTLALLPLVFVVGSGRSARLWINLGLFYLQPGELLKLTVPMMVAWYLHRVVLPPRWGTIIICGLIIGVPVALIVLQPDLGTGMLVAASGVFTLFLAGIAWWRIGLFAGLGIGALPVAWLFLMPYQKDRILTFINPESDPLGAGWNIIQSKIAIGSGGWMGKGWGQGSQAHLDFLPEHTTDLDCSQCPRWLFQVAGRRAGNDLLGLRAGQRRHGGRTVAGGWRADAAAQLWRYVGGFPSGRLWHRDVGASAPQIHVLNCKPIGSPRHRSSRAPWQRWQ